MTIACRRWTGMHLMMLLVLLHSCLRRLSSLPVGEGCREFHCLFRKSCMERAVLSPSLYLLPLAAGYLLLLSPVEPRLKWPLSPSDL